MIENEQLIERNNKTHSKVVGEKTKEIHSKVIMTSVVKAYSQMDKKEIFWLKNVKQCKVVKKIVFIFFGMHFIF